MFFSSTLRSTLPPYGIPCATKLHILESTLMFLQELTRFYNLSRTVTARREVTVSLDFNYCEIHDAHCAMQVERDGVVLASFTKRLAGYLRSLADKHARNPHYPLHRLANFLLYATAKDRTGPCRLVLEYRGATLIRALAHVPHRMAVLYMAGFVTGLDNQSGWDLTAAVANAQQKMLHVLCFGAAGPIIPSAIPEYVVPWFVPESDAYVYDVSQVLEAKGACRAIGADPCFARLIAETKTLPTIIGLAQVIDRLPTNLMLYGMEAELACCSKVLCCMGEAGVLYVAFVDTERRAEYIMPLTPAVFGY